MWAWSVEMDEARKGACWRATGPFVGVRKRGHARDNSGRH